jgi:hypothetical protein
MSVAELQSELADPLIVINGHDLCKIAHLCALRLFKRNMQGANEVFNWIADCYDVSDFVRTSTYNELIEWEATAAPYIVTVRPSV